MNFAGIKSLTRKREKGSTRSLHKSRPHHAGHQKNLTRVLHVMNNLAVGGGQFVVLNCAKYAGADFEVFVAAVEPPMDLEQKFREIGIQPYLPVGSSELRRVLSLVHYIRVNDIDIVHVHSGLDRKCGHLAALLTGRPVVSHLHSPWDHRQNMAPTESWAFSRLFGAVKAVMRNTIESATVRSYVAVSKSAAEFHTTLVPRAITLAENGVDLEQYRELDRESRRNALRRQLGISQNESIIMNVGRLARGKGQAVLIRLMPDLPDSHLILVGDGPLRSRLEALSKELELQERVHFLGQSSNVPQMFAGADVFAFASLSEGLPLAVLEAMASRVPVVIWELPGLSDVVVNDQTGVVVPQGDSEGLREQIRALLKDRKRAHRLSAAGQAHIFARFDVRNAVSQIESVYRLVLNLPR